MIEQKILEYIKSSLTQNKSKEDIYKELLNKGFLVDAINENFNAIRTEHTKEKEDTQKRTIQIIITIGTILIGAGIFSFIAANWQEISRPAKITIIIISMLSAYILGWVLKEKLNYAKIGGALILLGTIIYGAGIFLIAQMFNTSSNWPDGFILWMIGAIIMAFAIESFSLFYLAVILGIIALIGHPFGIFGNSMRYNPFILTSPILLCIATGLTFFSGWIIRKRIPKEQKEFY